MEERYPTMPKKLTSKQAENAFKNIRAKNRYKVETVFKPVMNIQKRHRENFSRDYLRYLNERIKHSSSSRSIENINRNLNLAKRTKSIYEKIISFTPNNLGGKNIRKIWKNYRNGKIDNNTLGAMIRSIKTVKSNMKEKERKNKIRIEIIKYHTNIKHLTKELERRKKSRGCVSCFSRSKPNRNLEHLNNNSLKKHISNIKKTITELREKLRKPRE